MASKLKYPRRHEEPDNWVFVTVGAIIAIVGVLAIVVVTFLSAPAKAEPAVKTPIDLLIEFRKVLWPHEVQAAPPPPPTATRPKSKSQPHWRFKKAPQTQAAPAPQNEPAVERAPAPRPKTQKPRVKKAPPAKSRPRVVVAQRKPSAGECAQIGLGVATVGKAGVRKAAPGYGYSAAQADRAMRDCGY